MKNEMPFSGDNGFANLKLKLTFGVTMDGS